MYAILTDLGLSALVLVILYAFKKGFDSLRFSQECRTNPPGNYEDYTIYKAARRYAQDAPEEEIRSILQLSYELDTRQIEQTLTLAAAFRRSGIDGYAALIRAVNKALEESLYTENNLERALHS